MKSIGLALFGWIVPGGAYLLQRRYLQFGRLRAGSVGDLPRGTRAARGTLFPQADELKGLDTATSLIFQAMAFAKVFAGGPYLLGHVFDGSQSFLQARLHEYGTTLLVLAGVFNLLAIADALELRKGSVR